MNISVEVYLPKLTADTVAESLALLKKHGLAAEL